MSIIFALQDSTYLCTACSLLLTDLLIYFLRANIFEFLPEFSFATYSENKPKLSFKHYKEFGLREFTSIHDIQKPRMSSTCWRSLLSSLSAGVLMQKFDHFCLFILPLPVYDLYFLAMSLSRMINSVSNAVRVPLPGLFLITKRTL